MTLIESLIAITVTAILFGGVLQSMRAATGLMESTTAELEMDRKLRHLGQQIRSRLQNARGTTITPAIPLAGGPGNTPFESSLTFQSVEGWDAGMIVLGPEQQLFVRTERSEVDNGVDDDGDGLIDELQLVHVPDVASGVEIVLSSGIVEFLGGETEDGTDENGNGLIDEPGFSVSNENGRLVVRFAIAGQAQDGTVVLRASEIGVTPQP
ncbi:MAG: hypothetical protein AAGG01_07735 [Planctomycetota bacterium]